MQELELIFLEATPAKLRELVSAISHGRAGYLAPPACHELEIAETSSGVTVLIRWASAEAHRARAQTAEAGAFFSKISSLVTAQPRIETIAGLPAKGRLQGEVALVTGASRGIGAAIVERFVAEGAHVFAVDVDASGLASMVERLGPAVATACADVSSIQGNEDAVRGAVDHFGKLDAFIPNAGLFDGFLDTSDATLEQLSDGFDKIFAVNAKGLILGCRAALPALVASGGSITVTLSNSALYPDGGGVLYVASKHAALGVVRQLAHEFAPVVRVNAVAPGATKSSMSIPSVLGPPQDQTHPEASSAISSLVPLARHAEPHDHASAYVLLSSRSESMSMTGTVIESDGGLGIRGLRRTRGGQTLHDRFGT